MSGKKADRISKMVADDLIDIFGHNEQEILNFIGVSTDVDEYELRHTNSTEILNLEHIKEEVEEKEAEVEEVAQITTEDKEVEGSQIQATDAEIEAELNKYLEEVRTSESIEFAKLNRKEIFERLKCKCFEWHRIKKRETIKDVIKQICKAKTCKEGVRLKESEERRKRKMKPPRPEEMRRYHICTGPIRRRRLRRKKMRKYTKRQIAELVSIKEKQSRETLRLKMRKIHDISKARDSSSSESTIASVTPIHAHKQLIRAKDSVILRKQEYTGITTERSSTESSSTISGNLQRLDSLEKIGKRKIKPNMFNMYLNQFNSIKNYAFVFIDNMLQEAEAKVNVNIIDPLEIDLKDYICPEHICGESQTDEMSIPERPISLYSEVYGYDLTPHEGKNMVRDIIKYWMLRKTWKHCINFLGQHTDSCSDYYNYEVKWSEPTFSYPVPQVTASVFFTVELSRVKPTLFPPRVTFVFESERYKFTAYDDIAHEKFLDEIIDCKTAFFKSMRF